MSDPVPSAESRRRARWIGIYFPTLMGLVVLVAITLWFPRLSDPVATQWDGSGPHGFTGRTAFLLVGPVLVVLSSIPMAAISLVRRSRWTCLHRILVSMSAGMAVFLAWLMIDVARIALDSVGTAATAGPAVLPPVLAGVVTWVVAWLLTPPAGTGSAPEEPILRLPRTMEQTIPTHSGELEWESTLYPEGPILVFLGIVMIPTVIIGLWAFATDPDPAAGWILALIIAVSILILIAVLVFRIRIAPAGFFARSVLGWPRITVPVEAIRSVTVEQIDPLGDFGGWGIRWMGRKRVGLVFRSGPGLMITQQDGRVVTVTLKEAESAGAMLLSAVDRHAGG